MMEITYFRSPISFNAVTKLANTKAFDSLFNIFYIISIMPELLINSSDTSYTLGTHKTAVFLT